MELNVDRDADLVRGCGWLRARGLASLYDTCEACILICAERATAHRAAASGAGLDLAVLSMDGRSRAGLAGDAPLIRLSRQGARRSRRGVGPRLGPASTIGRPSQQSRASPTGRTAAAALWGNRSRPRTRCRALPTPGRVGTAAAAAPLAARIAPSCNRRRSPIAPSAASPAPSSLRGPPSPLRPTNGTLLTLLRRQLEQP